MSLSGSLPLLRSLDRERAVRRSWAVSGVQGSLRKLPFSLVLVNLPLDFILSLFPGSPSKTKAPPALFCFPPHLLLSPLPYSILRGLDQLWDQSPSWVGSPGPPFCLSAPSPMPRWQHSHCKSGCKFPPPLLSLLSFPHWSRIFHSKYLCGSCPGCRLWVSPPAPLQTSPLSSEAGPFLPVTLLCF